MPDILLIRHGTRDESKGLADPQQPLSEQGKQEVQKLVASIEASKRIPTVILTSRNVHAVETARLICEAFGRADSAVVEMDALTPSNQNCLGHFMESKKEAAARGYDLDKHEVVAIVAHQPRLNQIYASLTALQTAPQKQGYGWAVRVTAGNTGHFAWGNAKGEWR